MATQITKVDVWAGEIRDQAGSVAAALTALAAAGAQVECVLGRRQPERPGTAVLFVSPVNGKKAQAAAREAGLSPAPNVATLRLETVLTPDVAVQVTGLLAEANLSLRGMTSVIVGKTFVAYLGFDGDEDARRAMKVLKGMK